MTASTESLVGMIERACNNGLQLRFMKYDGIIRCGWLHWPPEEDEGGEWMFAPREGDTTAEEALSHVLERNGLERPK